MDSEDLRLLVYREFAATGHAPENSHLAQTLGASEEEVRTALSELGGARHLVLDDSGAIVMAHPFSAVLGLTFYLRRRIGARLWRRMHRWTLAVYVLGVIHTLGAGTDASTPWMLWMLVLTGVPILFLTLLRFLPQRQRTAPRARTPATPSTPSSPGSAA